MELKDKLRLFVSYYHNLGMNITHIKGDNNVQKPYKNPTDKNWETYFDDSQDFFYINDQDWDSAEGVGIILGYQGYRAIDIDRLFFSQEDLLSKEDREVKIEQFIIKCLGLLGLPSDYEWVVDSGSGWGLHIIFRADPIENYSPDSLFFTHNSKFYHLDYNGFDVEYDIFERLELRWRDHLVVPPSKHVSGGEYTFRKNALPKHIPLTVSINNLNNLIDYYCAESRVFSFKYNEEDLLIAKSVKLAATYDSWRTAYNENQHQKEHANWLSKCYSREAYNNIAVKYLIGEDVKASKADALKYFAKADNYLSHFNLASLIAVGYIDGTSTEISEHLSYCSDIPNLVNAINKIKEKAKINKNNNKIHYLFFDTETTGIPLNYRAPSSDIQNWPRLVQLSWITVAENGEIISKHNHIIRPSGFKISSESTKVHGITDEIARSEGVDALKAIRDILLDINAAKCIVAHNVNFDKKVLGAELIRAGLNDTLVSKKTYCTMENSIDICKIPGHYGYKYPKLKELHVKLFGEDFSGAHNSENDVMATYRCYFQMQKNNSYSDDLPF